MRIHPISAVLFINFGAKEALADGNGQMSKFYKILEKYAKNI